MCRLSKNCKVFKISSSDINNFQLLEKVAKTNLPMVISTGASNVKRLRRQFK